jgi:hypothetical protein
VILKEKRDATKFMDAQSIAHLVIVLFIILGNVSYFVKRKKTTEVLGGDQCISEF